VRADIMPDGIQAQSVHFALIVHQEPRRTPADWLAVCHFAFLLCVSVIHRMTYATFWSTEDFFPSDKIRVKMTAKDTRVTFRVSSDLKKKLESVAASEGRSVAQICEAFLRSG
jgi:hypothetical protein